MMESCRVVLTVESVDQIMRCNHLNTTSSAVVLHTIYLVCCSNFWIRGWNRWLYGVTIQMKPLQQYFHMLLFIKYVVLTVDDMLWCDHSNETSEQYFRKVLFIYLVLLTFESVDETQWCDHSNETSWAVLSQGTIYLLCSSNFRICGRNPVVWPLLFRRNVFNGTFTPCFCFWPLSK